MSRTDRELWDRLGAAHRMPYGRTKTTTVEEIIRHADALGEDELRFAARMVATSAYTFGGEPAKAFVTFAWCLAAFDREGGRPDDEQELLWQFKWMTKLTDFPDIPLASAYAMLDDMERRYRLGGHTLNPVHQNREAVARHIGDRETAAEQYRLWCAAPRGSLSDCAACEPTEKVRFLTWNGRDEEAVAASLSVLDGSLDCLEQPQAILTSLLVPYLRTGRLEEAAGAHRRAYRLIQANRGELRMMGDHLTFCALTGNHARGLELVERHLGWLAEPPSPYADLCFSAAAALVLRLVTDAGHGDTPVRRPALDDAPATTLPAKQLHDELAARARGLARRFDERNGTSAVGDRIEATIAAEPLVARLPLSGLARRAADPAPEPVEELPVSPADLVALARRERLAGNHVAEAAVWRRFDEVCPDPESDLLAQRLSARVPEVAPDEAGLLVERVIALYEELGDPVQVAVNRSRLGLVWCHLGRVEEAVELVAATTAELMTIGDEQQRVRAQLCLGAVHELAGRDEQARAAFTTAVELAREYGDPMLVGDALYALAMAEAKATPARTTAAMALLRRAVTAYEAEPGSGALAGARILLGRLHASLGEWDEARAQFTAAERTTDPGVRANARTLTGQVALDQDRADEACGPLAAAVADLAAAGRPTALAKVTFAEASLAAGRPEEAADAVEEALAELPPEAVEPGKHARFVLVRAYRALGQHEQALPLCAEIAQLCAAEDNQAGAGQMHGIAGEILDELNRDDEAAAEFAVAAELFGAADEPIAALANRRLAALSWHWAAEEARCLDALAEADAMAAELADRLTADDGPDLAWQKAFLDYDAARIHANLGRAADGMARASAAADGFRAVGGIVESVAATMLRARLLADGDRVAEARELLTAAAREIPPDAQDARERLMGYLESLDQ